MLHSFEDWSFGINTVQLFCQCAWIWYPINSTERRMVIFAVDCDYLLRNWRKRQFIFFFRNLHLLSFPTIYNLLCFPLKWRAYEFFPREHPRRSGVTLTFATYLSLFFRKRTEVWNQWITFWMFFCNVQRETISRTVQVLSFIQMVILMGLNLSTDWNVTNTLYKIINSTTGKHCSIAFIWMYTNKDCIQRLKS